MVNTEIRLIIFFAAKDGEALYNQQKQDLTGSDHELLIAKFRLKLKKVGKTTRPFRYDLNQIPYSYTVEVRNRFKGLDLIDRVPDEIWTEVHDIDTHRPTSKSHDMKFVTSSPFSSINAAASLRCECNVQIFL